MPPTINSNPAAEPEKRPPRLVERKLDLLCRVKYSNTLPDIPSDLKFLQYPFDSHRFVQYNPTSLERNYKYDVLTEHDLGVSIDLVDRELYQADPYAHLDPADEKLLEEEVHTPHDSVRSRQHSRSVSWLRKSEYISTEQTRFQPQNLENIEAKVGYNVKKSLREETLYLDREAQIKAIEKTFAESKKEIVKHYSKPNVVPLEVFPVYPDFKNWKFPCAQVIFDSDPATAGKTLATQEEEMSQAMIRGVMDQSGEQFVAYFLPTEETLEKRRTDAKNQVPYTDDEEYEYRVAREYNWNVKSKTSKGYEENYFFVIRPDGVFYNELETRVRLNKRRMKAGHQPSNTKLVVKHRPLDAEEHRMQRYRERVLEAPGDEEEEEEDEEITTTNIEVKEMQPPSEEMEVNGEQGVQEENGGEQEAKQNDSAKDTTASDGQLENGRPEEMMDWEENEAAAAPALAPAHRRSLSRTPPRRDRSRSPLRTTTGSHRSHHSSRSASRELRSASRSRTPSHSSSRSGGSKRSREASQSTPSRSPTPSIRTQQQQSMMTQSSPAQGSASGSSDFRSPSRSPSGSASRSSSRSPTRSRSASPARGSPQARSGGSAASQSPMSPTNSEPNNQSTQSPDKFHSPSRSPSPHSRSPSGSPVRSPSVSPSRSGSRSPSRSPSHSPSASRSGSSLSGASEPNSEVGGSDAEE